MNHPSDELRLEGMAEADRLEFDQPDTLEEEDEATLAAIDRGDKAAMEGRVIPASEVRERVKQWLSKSFTPKTR